LRMTFRFEAQMNRGFWTKKKAPKFPKTPGARRTIETMPKRDLEKVLDQVFSQWVRKSSAGGNGLTKCVTCGTWKHWKDIDCGHYISRAMRRTRWEEMNCAPQCAKCNRFLDGQKHIFRAYLVGLYGEEPIKTMENDATVWGQAMHSEEWMQERIRYYREILSQMD
jgi:hypothetical protein